MMNDKVVVSRLTIRGSQTTPNVDCDPTTGILYFWGVSMPENVTGYYGPILAWLRDYAQRPAEKTILRYNFNYFNTATSKILMEMIAVLENIAQNGLPCEIEWHYAASDNDMREAGEDYAILTRIPFKFVPRD